MEQKDMAPEEHVTEEQNTLEIEDIKEPLQRLPVVNLFNKVLLLENEITARIEKLSYIKKWKKYQLQFWTELEGKEQCFTMSLNATAFNDLVVKFGTNADLWVGKKFTMTGEEFKADPKSRKQLSDGITVIIR